LPHCPSQREPRGLRPIDSHHDPSIIRHVSLALLNHFRLAGFCSRPANGTIVEGRGDGLADNEEDRGGWTAAAALDQAACSDKIAADRLARAYVDEETGQRGYLLTGDPAFLQPYRAGRADAVTLEAELKTRLAGDQLARQPLAEVVEAEYTWRTDAAEPEIAARGQDALPSSELLATARNGKRLFDALRVQLELLQARTKDLDSPGAQPHLTSAAWSPTL
jgi:hypothetical protein